MELLLNLSIAQGGGNVRQNWDRWQGVYVKSGVIGIFMVYWMWIEPNLVTCKKRYMLTGRYYTTRNQDTRGNAARIKHDTR